MINMALLGTEQIPYSVRIKADPEWTYFETQVKKENLRYISHEPPAGETLCQNSPVRVGGVPSILRRNYNQSNFANECTKNNTRCGSILPRRKPVLYGRHSYTNRVENLKHSKSLSTVVEEMPPPQGDEISHRRAISNLAKNLRSNCDKILDSSIPFVIDSCLLGTVSDAIDTVMSNDPNMGKENADEIKYQDYVMFLSDFFEQTPSLCLTPGTAITVVVQPSIDMQYFRNLQFLELRKVQPSLLTGLNSVKASLKRLKCTRCLDSLSQVLTPVGTYHLPEDTDSEAGQSVAQPLMSTNITCVWPELIEIDFSFNRIYDITTASDCLEVTPLVETLNLSRNMISVIDDSFTKVLNCLSVLNLNYNKLTIIPPLPPNLKVLLLAHNYITNLTVPTPTMSFSINSLKHLEMLDLSTNMISDENDLSILRQLSSLTNVAFMGNPLSYLESYRTTVCCNLNRLVLKKSFTLDKKKLSNSEIRTALESMKQPKFVPFIPSDTLGLPMTSSFTTGACSKSNRFDKLKSLTQSYDSSSSSLRSSCRKKPKIREIVLDNDEDEVSSVSKKNNKDIEVILAPVPKVQRQYSSGSSSPSEKSEIIVLETKATIASIRETYGEEYWLLKQAGDKMKKLLKIPDRPVNPHAEMLYSKSLPKSNTYSYLDGSKDTNQKATRDTLTDAELLILSVDRSNKTLESNNGDSTKQSDMLVTAKTSFDVTQGTERSADLSEGSIFYSCNSVEITSERHEEDNLNIQRKMEELENTSIFDFETDVDTPEIFSDRDGQSDQFRIFQSGNCFALAIMCNYLYEIEPEDSIVLTKWDLKSLKSLQEEHCDSETETVEFSLQFDTMKKQLREKTFVMSAKDFSRFDKLVSPYIEERALQEFADAMQCIKCNTQFSRAMANKVVKQEKGHPPKEITVCPNPDCRSEFLVPLDDIPLPNNGVLSVEGTDFLFKGPLRSSTPISGNVSMSIPKHSGQSARHMEAKAHASSLTTRVTRSKSSNHNHSNSDSIETVPRPATASSSEKSSITVLNTRSDSDIEVLSCDSSSIEVLAKNSGDSGSDIEVQEALEVEVIEGTSKSGKSVVMTESTSSGSQADSICTTYEKKLMANMQPLSQQFSPRVPILSSPSTSTSFSSLTSTSTLTTYSPSRSTTAVPIRYDYNDFKVDHRLQLFCELVVFKSKSVEEKLIMLTKVLTISDASAPFLSIMIISNRKIYFYKIVGVEGEKPQDWLQKVSNFDVSKLLKLDVLIGRHGVGLDLSGKYYALLFRDSQRTLNFVKFFMGISDDINLCPMVRDFSQTQKALMSSSPVSYFGILRFAVCDSDKSYAVSAVVLTDEELMLLGDLGWLAVRSGSVTAKHTRHLSSLRQVESLESDPTFVRLVIEAENYLLWEFLFETEEEKDIFVEMLKSQTKNVPFISLSQPIDP